MMVAVSNIISAQINDPRVLTEDEHLVNGNTNLNVNYYAGKSSVKGNTITFKVIDGQKKYKTIFSSLILCNEKNKLDFSSRPIVNGRVAPFTNDIDFNPYDYKIEEILSSCLPEDARDRLNKCSDEIGLSMFVNPKTGEIDEVIFSLIKSNLKSSKGSIYSLPPQVFENMEKRLKSEFKFAVREKYLDYPFVSLGSSFSIDYLYK